jgi:hypothetical protein
VPDITPDFNEDEWSVEPKPRSNGQRRGRITGRVRNSQVAPQSIAMNQQPNRADRRWYQKHVTKRSDRLHLVLFGGWRKHDTRQQIAHRRSMLAGQNMPVDGLTRAERRAEHAVIYRAWRKSHSRRITPSR